MKNQSVPARGVLGAILIATLLGTQGGCVRIAVNMDLRNQHADMKRYTVPIDLTKAGSEVNIDFRTPGANKLSGWVIGIMFAPKNESYFYGGGGIPAEDIREKYRDEMDDLFESVTGIKYSSIDSHTFGVQRPIHKKIKAQVAWTNKDTGTIIKQGICESDDFNGSRAATRITYTGAALYLDHLYLHEGLQPNTNYQVKFITIQVDDRFNLKNYTTHVSLGHW